MRGNLLIFLVAKCKVHFSLLFMLGRTLGANRKSFNAYRDAV